MDNVSALREHLRLPGMGLTTVRYFRDKLAMRTRARKQASSSRNSSTSSITTICAEFMARVNPAHGSKTPLASFRHRHEKDSRPVRELWPLLDQLGDQQSFYLLEQFIPGAVFHVDSVVSERESVFAEAHAYGTPPLDVSHQGGVFTTRTLPREASETKRCIEAIAN